MPSFCDFTLYLYLFQCVAASCLSAARGNDANGNPILTSAFCQVGTGECACQNGAGECDGIAPECRVTAGAAIPAAEADVVSCQVGNYFGINDIVALSLLFGA